LLEDGKVTVARVASRITFPSEFMQLAALNPCRCDYLADLKPIIEQRVTKWGPEQVGPSGNRLFLGPFLFKFEAQMTRGE
jgi:predicted ATPase with chaperone activity